MGKMSKNNIINLLNPVEVKKPSVLLAEKIIDLIFSGSLKIGDQLPDEEYLATNFKLKLSSVRKATEFLYNLGIIKVLPSGIKIIENSTKRTKSVLPNKKNFDFINFDGQKIKKKKYRIGFSQTTTNHPARQYMDQRFHNYANEINICAITKSADWSIEKEKRNINKLIEEKVNGIIISTHFREILKTTLEDISKKNIPIVVFASGRPYENLSFSAWACTNEWQQGRVAGYYMCIRIRGKGEVGQILGTEESSITEARRDGILTALDDFPEVKLVSNIYTDWYRTQAEESAAKMIKKHENIKAIITHCDEQALGASIAIKKIERQNKKNKILIFSVSDCQKECFELINSDEIELTQNYEQDGSIALNIMLQILEGYRIPKLINLGTSFVTKDTINSFKPNF